MVSRKIIWLSSIDSNNKNVISNLENKLSAFYSGSPNYYNDIDFTSGNWINDQEIGYLDILKEAKKAGSVLEIGCGSANVLKYTKELQNKYSGCDFSEELVKGNMDRFPEARFQTIKEPNKLPYSNSAFDLVFSIYVLEHSANPALFLDECVRVLKPGGLLIILCPNFLDYGRMSSQRAGFTTGTSKDKLMQNKYLDAIITFYDNRIRIPAYCKYLRYKSIESPKFYINIYPTVFTDNFNPDVDAVYVTSRQEIVSYLKQRMVCIKNSPEFLKYEKEKKMIYLKFQK